jgi:hypothetical protein
MTLDLTAEESAALLRELDHIIDGDRHPFSRRIGVLKGIREKIQPYPTREPLPAPKRYEPPRPKPSRRRGLDPNRARR